MASETMPESGLYTRPIGGGVEAEHTRAFLKIQDGCNSFCTFCVIPFARGKSRSLSIPHLVEKINEFHAQGLNEVVLTGVHIGDYESENNKNFDDLNEPGKVLYFNSERKVRPFEL